MHQQTNENNIQIGFGLEK